jgi:hypothetical protein
VTAQPLGVPIGRWVFMAALVLAWDAAAVQAGAPTMARTESTEEMARDRRAVEAWLMRAPFDELRPDLGPGPFSYEAWFDEGRALARAVDILIDLIAEEDLQRPSGRGMRAAYALGWIGDGRARGIQALLRALGSRDNALRMEAAAALGRLGSATLAPRLEPLCRDAREDENVRANACIALGRLAAPSSLPLLQRAAADTNAFVAAAAREALRLFEHPEPRRR